MEPAPGWRIATGRAARPGIGTQVPRAVDVREAPDQLLVYGCSGRSWSWTIVPVSASCPAYMTSARSQVSATTDRSWVMRISDRPSSRAQPLEQLEDLRLDHDVERRRGLVPDDQRRVAGERHRDHHALAHAARELVRVALPRFRLDAHQLEQLPAARSRSRAPSAHRGGGSARRSGRRRDWTGLRAFIAPWKMMLMSRQRCGAAGPRSWATSSMPKSRMRLPEVIRPFVGSSRTMIESAVVVLPQPDSPTSPSASPG